ncbi:T9SS type A sorting domain-containing protein [Pontibacter ruber]|uniref:T9SS type A sorting domain-containing protein n=1 Tax=Pontibacter ruber TaxID=1343895 RepID=A0ABW5CWE1_9BACT|nr:T9SS type A sorting domain-containing protein [Pontibacter ruber]
MKTPVRMLFAVLVALFFCGAAAAQSPAISSTLKDAQNVKAKETLVNFTVTTTQGNAPAGTMVKGRFEFTNANIAYKAPLIDLEYEETANNWKKLPVSTAGAAEFGPATGFALGNTSFKFRVRFNAADVYNYNLKLVPASGTGDPVAVASESVTVDAVEEAIINSTLDVIEGITINKEVEFQAIVNAQDRQGDLVNVVMKLKNPAQAGKITLKFSQDTENPVYSPLTFNDQGEAKAGPEGGFPLEGEALRFAVTFTEAGIYDYTFLLLREDGTLLASVDEKAAVAEFEGTAISSTLNNKADVKTNTATDFAVTTARGAVEANTPVRIKFTFDQAAVGKVTMQAQAAGGTTFEPMTISNEGVAFYGPEAGFTFADATTNFKITFAEANTYRYAMQVIRVSDNKVLAAASEAVNVTGVTAVKDEIENTRIRVYPTLANGAVTVDLGTVRNAQVTVVDALGRTMVALDKVDEKAEINTTAFAKGLYFVRIVKGGEVAISRFIVR